MKLGMHPDNIFCQNFLDRDCFGDKVSENKVFALNKHYYLTSASFRQKNE